MFTYDSISTRDAFGNALLKIDERNPLVTAIGADTTTSMGLKGMQDKYPERVLNIGIAEQNMTADAASTEVITEKISEIKGPVYLRLGRGPVVKVFDEKYRLEIGKANTIKPEGNDMAIICNGAVVARVIEAVKLLEAKGFAARIIEMSCVKPIDADAIADAVKAVRVIITVEEHNIIGGLGSAVAEVLSERHTMPLLRLGIEDVFTESGPHQELMDKYGFKPSDISDRIIEFHE